MSSQARYRACLGLLALISGEVHRRLHQIESAVGLQRVCLIDVTNKLIVVPLAMRFLSISDLSARQPEVFVVHIRDMNQVQLDAERGHIDIE